MGVLLKPLRVKRDITAERRRESRQTAGSKQGRRGKEMRAARQRGPVFPAPQARGLSRRGQTGTDAPSPALFPNQSTNIETGI
jgi:hypothetical protein